MVDIFISYSRKDSVHAQMLADRFRSSGATVWMDIASLEASQFWSAEIVHAIKECSTFIVLLSPDSVASHNVNKEVGLASELRKKIVPIEIIPCTLSDSMMFALAGVHRISLFDEDSLLRSFTKLAVSNNYTGMGETTTPDFGQSNSESGLLRLAVLPFEDLSQGKDHEWFADGMMDELINTLGSLDKLHVNPRTDVIYYKGRKAKLDELASDLKCRYIVEGGVQKSGDKIRIRVSLSDAKEHKQIWSEKYDGTFDDIFELQDKTCFAITEALKLKLTPEEQKIVQADPTKNVEAYELFLKAIGFQRRYTRDGYEHSLKLLDEALLLDGNFTDAYISRSYACATYYREYSRDPAWLEKAIEAIEKAENISSVTAMTLRARSEIAMLRGNFDEAEQLIRKAIAIEPDYKELYNLLGNIYLYIGNLPEAAISFEKALSLGEDISGYHNLLTVLSQLKQPEKLQKFASLAVTYSAKYIRRNPDEIFPRMVHAYSLLWAGRTKEAHTEAERLFTDPLHDANTLYNLGGLFEELGDVEKNLDLISRSVNKGFRQIEMLQRLNYEDPSYQRKMDDLIIELESIIEHERRGKNNPVTDKEQNHK